MSSGPNVYAGMQVNHSSQLEAWSPRWTGLLSILLITHENRPSGCWEDWLFCGPCYFSRDLQWNVFYLRWGCCCCAGASSSHIELWSGSLLERLRRQWPKTARADSPHHFPTSFSLHPPSPAKPCPLFLCSGDRLFAGIPTLQPGVAKGVAKQGLVFRYWSVF